jgi:hypothetical protein
MPTTHAWDNNATNKPAFPRNCRPGPLETPGQWSQLFPSNPQPGPLVTLDDTPHPKPAFPRVHSQLPGQWEPAFPGSTRNFMDTSARHGSPAPTTDWIRLPLPHSRQWQARQGLLPGDHDARLRLTSPSLRFQTDTSCTHLFNQFPTRSVSCQWSPVVGQEVGLKPRGVVALCRCPLVTRGRV